MNQAPYVQMWKVNRGWIVHVGCQRLVFSHDEKAQMIGAFSDLIMLGEKMAADKWCDKGDPYPGARLSVDGWLEEVPEKLNQGAHSQWAANFTPPTEPYVVTRTNEDYGISTEETN